MTFLGIIALAIVRLQDLFSVVMLSSLYSLLSASIFVALDAVDVAFTEAAVGAGVSTVLLLSVLSHTGRWIRPPYRGAWLPLLVVILTGAALAYGTLDMPHMGDPMAPAHNDVSQRYLEKSSQEIGIPNVVTSILASYRGYDTLGETTVIFTAAVSVMVLLGRRGRRRRSPIRNRGDERT